MLRSTAVSLVSVVFFGGTVLASEIEPTSRGSFVTVAGEITDFGDYADEISSDDFKGFSEEIEGSFEHPRSGSLAESFAQQGTDIQPSELSGFGEVWASWIGGLGTTSGNAAADSFFEIEFTLAQSAMASFSGELTTEGDGLSSAEALLCGPVVVEFTKDGPFAWRGVLPAGDYFLGVDAFARVDATFGTDELFAMTQFDFLLSVECIACAEDLDSDGEVGFGDVLEVLSAWGPCPGCPQDLSGDDEVGFDDLLLVLSAWGPC